MQTFSITSVSKTLPSVSTSDFSFELGESIDIGTHGLKKAYLTQFICPFSWYTVNSTNNTLIFNEGGGDKAAIFAPGTYTHSLLAGAVSDALNSAAVLNVYTCTYNVSQDTFTITTDNFASFKFSVAATTCEDLLGFTSVDSGNVLFYTSSLSPKILPSQIFLNIEFKENSETLLQTSDNWHTFSFPVVSDFKQLIVYKPDIPMLIQLFNKSAILKSVKIDLYDEDSKTKLDLRGRDIEIEIRLEK